MKSTSHQKPLWLCSLVALFSAGAGWAASPRIEAQLAEPSPFLLLAPFDGIVKDLPEPGTLLIQEDFGARPVRPALTYSAPEVERTIRELGHRAGMVEEALTEQGFDPGVEAAPVADTATFALREAVQVELREVQDLQGLYGKLRLEQELSNAPVEVRELVKRIAGRIQGAADPEEILDLVRSGARDRLRALNRIRSSVRGVETLLRRPLRYNDPRVLEGILLPYRTVTASDHVREERLEVQPSHLCGGFLRYWKDVSRLELQDEEDRAFEDAVVRRSRLPPEIQQPTVVELLEEDCAAINEAERKHLRWLAFHFHVSGLVATAYFRPDAVAPGARPGLPAPEAVRRAAAGLAQELKIPAEMIDLTITRAFAALRAVISGLTPEEWAVAVGLSFNQAAGITELAAANLGAILASQVSFLLRQQLRFESSGKILKIREDVPPFHWPTPDDSLGVSTHEIEPQFELGFSTRTFELSLQQEQNRLLQEVNPYRRQFLRNDFQADVSFSPSMLGVSTFREAFRAALIQEVLLADRETRQRELAATIIEEHRSLSETLGALDGVYREGRLWVEEPAALVARYVRPGDILQEAETVALVRPLYSRVLRVVVPAGGRTAAELWVGSRLEVEIHTGLRRRGELLEEIAARGGFDLPGNLADLGPSPSLRVHGKVEGRDTVAEGIALSIRVTLPRELQTLDVDAALLSGALVSHLEAAGILSTDEDRGRRVILWDPFPAAGSLEVALELAH